MSRRFLARSVLLPAVCSALVACSSDSPTETVEDEAATVARFISELSASQSAASSAMSAGGTPTPPSGSGTGSGSGPATPNPPQCVYDAATQRFNCPDMTRTTPNGTTTTKLYFQLLDAADAAQSEFDKETTASIRQVTDVSGTLNQNFTSSPGPGQTPTTVNVPHVMTNHMDMKLTGIKTDTRRQSGTGAMAVTIRISATDSVMINATQTFTDVGVVKITPGQANQALYPISGTIVATVTGNRASQPGQGSTTTQTTTYSSDGVATLVIKTQQGQTLRTCTIDMKVANSTPNCS